MSIFTVALNAAPRVQTPGGFSFGPYLGAGLSWGNRADFKENIYNKKPGASTQFGFSFYKFTAAQNSYGISLGYLQSRYNFSEKQATQVINPDTKYQVNEKTIILPLEYNYFIDPDDARTFIGIAAVPGIVTGKTLQRMRANSSDTTSAAIYPELNAYQRISVGFKIKIGFDGDIGVNGAGRIFIEMDNRFYGAKLKKNSHTLGVFLTCQYFFNRW